MGVPRSRKAKQQAVGERRNERGRGRGLVFIWSCLVSRGRDCAQVDEKGRGQDYNKDNIKSKDETKQKEKTRPYTNN
jgi:hypothetical protein